MDSLQIKEKLQMLIEYERIDSPTDKKQRIGWAMYTTQKIMEYLGAEELSKAYNFPLMSLTNPQYPSVAKMITKDLLA